MATVGIVGASEDRAKFGNKALRAHRQRGWEVYPVHPRAREVEGKAAVPCVAELPSGLDRITLYVQPGVGFALLEEIAERRPRELFLNPGTSTPALVARARELGLAVRSGCSIVDIGESPSDY